MCSQNTLKALENFFIETFGNAFEKKFAELFKEYVDRILLEPLARLNTRSASYRSDLIQDGIGIPESIPANSEIANGQRNYNQTGLQTHTR